MESRNSFEQIGKIGAMIKAIDNKVDMMLESIHKNDSDNSLKCILLSIFLIL